MQISQIISQSKYGVPASVPVSDKDEKTKPVLLSPLSMISETKESNKVNTQVIFSNDLDNNGQMRILEE